MSGVLVISFGTVIVMPSKGIASISPTITNTLTNLSWLVTVSSSVYMLMWYRVAPVTSTTPRLALRNIRWSYSLMWFMVPVTEAQGCHPLRSVITVRPFNPDCTVQIEQWLCPCNGVNTVLSRGMLYTAGGVNCDGVYMIAG